MPPVTQTDIPEGEVEEVAVGIKIIDHSHSLFYCSKGLKKYLD
jgi:hypothetical protein